MFQLKREYKDYESKTLRLPKVLVEQLSAEADKNNLSFNKAVIQCIEYSLEHMKTDNTDNMDF